MRAPAPLARLPRSQETTLAFAAHAPRVVVTETKLTPGGKGSLTMADEMAGPRLVTLIVQVRLLPTITGFGWALWVRNKSAIGSPVVIERVQPSAMKPGSPPCGLAFSGWSSRT